MNKIKAIETIYNGYRFRSRLEARWAVFFDALGIKYEYEKEGFKFGNGKRYLPDFWLPDVGLRSTCKEDSGTFVEIKPEGHKIHFDSKEFSLYESFALCGKTKLIVCCGYPDIFQDGKEGALQFAYHNEGVWPDWPMTFCKCYSCGRVKFEFSEGNYMVCESCHSHECDYEHPKILSATIAAKQARFEHGEKGIK